MPDLTKDGLGEFYVRDTHRVYLYDGASLAQLFTIDSSPLTATCDPDFTTQTADSAGDLTGDGVPDLMFGQECAAGFGQVVMVDGTNGTELFRVSPPENRAYFGHTVRLLPDMTNDGKHDWLIHSREGPFGSGQSGTLLGAVHLFDSQTRKVVRTLRNTEAAFSFNMEYVAVIPDVDGDGKPELLTGSRFASRRDGQTTYTKAGRALVRSLETGKVLYELLDPEPRTDGAFSLLALCAAGDVNGDGISDIAIGAAPKNNRAGGVYLFSGADGRWLRTLKSPKSQLGFFGGRIQAMGDLNGDGVPELWIEENLATVTHLFDGRTSTLLKTIKYPGLVHNNPLGGPKFTIGIVQQEASPGIRALLFAAPQVPDFDGRVYYMPFTPLPKLPRLKATGKTSSGFRLQVTGESGSKVEVQGTGDFRIWDPVASVTLGNQPAEVEDSAAANQSQRFYRAVQKE
ncbi:MAG: FG-GAP repeat protein [Verrucomicrobia bacterium]|nr:FG-GAP repeat protein [Verrucomicrobiota bacterium]